MRRRPVRHLALALALAWPSAGCRREAPRREPIRIAAAADLALAFTELGQAFGAAHGDEVIFSFGSTGLLARQIVEGAPFDVFAAAHVRYVDDAVRAERCDGTTRALYARGRLALFWPRGVAAPSALRDLAAPRFRRIAIANPDHAPYGRAAHAALRQAGLLPTVEGRLVFGENVQQALQFAQSGNADAALVALSLARAATDGEHRLVEPSLHPPIDQALALCRGASPDGGRRFIAFVRSSAGQALLARHGFLPVPQTPDR